MNPPVFARQENVSVLETELEQTQKIRIFICFVYNIHTPHTTSILCLHLWNIMSVGYILYEIMLGQMSAPHAVPELFFFWHQIHTIF